MAHMLSVLSKRPPQKRKTLDADAFCNVSIFHQVHGWTLDMAMDNGQLDILKHKPLRQYYYYCSFPRVYLHISLFDSDFCVSNTGHSPKKIDNSSFVCPFPSFRLMLFTQFDSKHLFFQFGCVNRVWEQSIFHFEHCD